MIRRRYLIPLAIATSLAVGTAAVAYWSVPGSGVASASVATLNAPAGVSAGATPGSGTVDVGWTGSTLSTGQAATGYYVTRIRTSDSATAPACGTTPAAPTAATGCDDLAVPDGTYHYVVTAVYYSWTATSAASDDVTVVNDNTPPTVTINQGVGQADPTGTSPINFRVVFSEAVTGFTGSDVTLAGATTATVTGSGTTYDVAVSGMTGDGTVTASVGAGSAQDGAGNPNTASTSTDNTVTYDVNGPVNALSLTATSSAHLSGTTLYYNGNASSRTFRLVNVLADAASGPVSTTFPTISGTGWTHNAETVTTPAGGPYTSSPFTWDSGASAPSGYTVTGHDAAGNATVTNLTFVNDGTAPSGGSISYPDGYVTALSVPITLTGGTDAGSGISATGTVVQRQSASLSNGSCGSYGSFTTVTLTAGADTTVATDTCYRYQYVISDNVGNMVTRTSTNVAQVDATAPHLDSINLVNGDAGAGRIGRDDEVTLTFSERLNPQTICSSWGTSGDQSLTASGVVTVTVTKNPTGGDTLTVHSSGCTLNLGTVNLGGAYVSGVAGATATFSGNGANASELHWDEGNRTLTITLGARTGAAANTGVAAGTATWTGPGSGALPTDLAGVPLSTATVSTADQRL